MLLIFKKHFFWCSSRNQKLQKKVVKNCQSHRNKFSGHFEKSRKILLICFNRAKILNSHAKRPWQKNDLSRVRLS